MVVVYHQPPRYASDGCHFHSKIIYDLFADICIHERADVSTAVEAFKIPHRLYFYIL